MKYKSVMIFIMILLFFGCATPMEQWKDSFEGTLVHIAGLKTSNGELENYKGYYEATDYLAKLSDSEFAVDLLKDRLLTGDSFVVRAASAEVLGRIGVREDAYILMNGLNDENAFVREKIAKALKKLTLEEFGEDQEQWLKWWQKHKEKNNE